MYDDLLGPRKEIPKQNPDVIPKQNDRKITGGVESKDPNAKPAQLGKSVLDNAKPNSDKNTDVWSDIEELLDEDEQCGGDCDQCEDENEDDDCDPC